MNVETLAVLDSLTPGFRDFVFIVAGLIVFAIVLALVGRTDAKLAPAARKLNRYILLCVLAGIILFPIYMMVVNSLLQSDVLARRPPTLFPSNADWGSYGDAWNAGHIGRYLFNSMFVTILTVVGQMTTAIMAAYAFAFLEFPLKRLLFVVFLSTMMVPFEVTFFTNVQTVSSLGDIPLLGQFMGRNTYGALVVPFLATGFGAFLVRQAFMSLPSDLRDAAALDGYGHFRFLTRVAVPLARPSIAALALFSFFGAWNQYLWPLVVTDDDKYRTVQVGLRQLARTSLDRFNVTFAGTVLAALPLFILLIVFQKQLVRGLTAGAVKG